MSGPITDRDSRADADNRQYIVVARRYRPQSFSDLVGQSAVSQALCNAIATERVGHAYLFTGARGVGKTSMARIFAKALNCTEGPTTTPCGQCDVCQSVASGDDVDVLEIDGASNRGIDEIRQLRSNAGIRPSRTRFKVYIIDEVHMLTKEAFNALLKTLEEPPEHVKFIFCTTAPEKIPITVLSRCQRFDFSPVEVSQIVARLRHILDAEGATADDEALEILARRAGGSMRDSQSLLEQLLAFGGGDVIKAEDVHTMLGTAGAGRLLDLLEHLVKRDTPAALVDLQNAISQGVDVGQLGEQLMGTFRDVMAVLVGCQSDMMLHIPVSEYEQLVEYGQQWGLETVMAASQILDQTVTRMKQSTQPNVLLEIAFVRIASLEDLDSLGELIAELKTQTPAVGRTPAQNRSRPVKKKAPPETAEQNVQRSDAKEPNPSESPTASVITAETAETLWKNAISQIGGITEDFAGQYESIAISAPNRLVVTFRPKYNSGKAFCERPERQSHLEKALTGLAGQPIRAEFRVLSEDGPHPHDTPPKPVVSTRQMMRDAVGDPMVKRAIELFGAEVADVQVSDKNSQ